jgi:hypothetical protein
MGRTAGQFCSRESAYQSVIPNNMMTSFEPQEQPARNAMTWQQKEDFGEAVVSKTDCTASTLHRYHLTSSWRSSPPLLSFSSTSMIPRLLHAYLLNITTNTL